MSSESHFLISVAGPGISGADGYFATKTGGEPSVQVQRDYDGGASVPSLSYGRKQWTALRIGRRYDVARDARLYAGLQPHIGTDERYSATIQPTDASFVPTGPSQTFNAVLTGATPPAVNANGTGPARFEMILDILSEVFAQ